jgi:hypothetical protein
VSAAPLAGYLRWHVREALGRVATPLGIFLLMGVLPLWSFARMSGFEAMRTPGPAHDQAILIYSSTLGLAMTLGAMVAASGFIALDRERQHFRFLFSHPVRPWAFYLQRYVVTALLFTAVMTLIPVGYGAIVAEVPVLGAGASSLLYVLLYGSLAMLCGALLNRDGIAFIAVVILGNVLQDAREALPRALQVLGDALPPFDAAGDVRTALLRGAAADAGDVVHVVAYSLAMLAAALFVVRRAPLAR